MTRSTSELCSSAVTADMPMSPVGPVTATVHPMNGWLPAAGAAKRPSGVRECLCGGVVSRDEGDARPAVTAGASQIQAVDRDRLIDIAFRSWTIAADLIGMDQAVAVVAAWSSEHGAHVLRRERGVPDDQLLEVGRQRG